MARKISEGRKVAFYSGTILMGIGFLLFLSSFFFIFSNFGDHSNFGSNAKSFGFSAVGGFILLIAGSIVRGIGARGLAGSGAVLDPERAREEIEPFSRMAGGMAKDFLEEADVDLSGIGGKSEKVVMIKCQACEKLNEEDSKFCQECGAEI